MPPLAGFSVCPAEQSLHLGHSGLGGHAPGPPLPSPAALLATSARPTPLLREDGFAVRDLWNICSGLLRLDACELHHLAPLLGFIDDELSKVRGRTGEHRNS